MRSKRDNAAAADLWRQVFSNLSTHEYASLMRDDYDPAEDQAGFRRAMTEAGWSEQEIDMRLKMSQSILVDAPVTSPRVNPHVEAWFARLCDDVEAAMERLQLKSHERIARGVEPRLGPYAAKLNVVMTEEGIVVVGAHMFRFCGLIARAFTRTLLLDPGFWESPDWDEARARELLGKRPDLYLYWMRIYLSYACTGTNILAPFRPATKDEVFLFEQVARAMELFAIAHEYGHHNFDHGRQLGDDAQAEEFEADQFALRVCYEIERYPLLFPNPYLASGAGGAVLLLALETLREVGSILIRSKPKRRDTHPPALARIDRFNTVAVLKPAEHASWQNFRLAATRIMTSVDHMLTQMFKELPPDALRAFEPEAFEPD